MKINRWFLFCLWSLMLISIANVPSADAYPVVPGANEIVCVSDAPECSANRFYWAPAYANCPANRPYYCDDLIWTYYIVETVSVASNLPSGLLSTTESQPVLVPAGNEPLVTFSATGSLDSRSNYEFTVYISFYNYDTYTWEAPSTIVISPRTIHTYSINKPSRAGKYKIWADVRANYVYDYDVRTPVYYFTTFDFPSGGTYSRTPSGTVYTGKPYTSTVQNCSSLLNDCQYRFYKIDEFGYETEVQRLSDNPNYVWTPPSTDAWKSLSLFVDVSTKSKAAAFGEYSNLGNEFLWGESFTVMPGPTIDTSVLPIARLNESYTATLTATGGEPPYKFKHIHRDFTDSQLPPGLTLSDSGTITGTPTSTGSYTTEFKVEDAQIPNPLYDFKALGLTVISPLTITTTTPLQSLIINESSSDRLYASGGFGVYTWTLDLGSLPLPPGLTLLSDGHINGQPTNFGSYSFTAKVSDSQQSTPESATKVFTINVYSQIAITSNALSGGQFGIPYSQALTASNGNGTYTWSLQGGTIPPGLSLNPSGVVSGMPMANGDYSFTVKVVDGFNFPAVRSIFLRIVYAPVTITNSTTSLFGNSGVSFSKFITASGGDGTYTWSITGGALPPGINLNSSTGELYGTPTTGGDYSFTITVNDGVNPTASKAFTLKINAPPSITTASIPNGASGTAYSQQLYASGGNGLYVWSVISGSLPAGLSLSSNGTLSGIPADVGQFSFTAQVADTQNSSSASHSYSMTITNGAMQQCADNPVSVSSGASPNVCTLSTTNVISGVVDHDQELFTTKGGMQNIAISLFYKSLPAYNGSLGIGWSHSYDISLILYADGSVILKNSNGDKRYYTKSGSAYVSLSGDFSTLVKNADNSYTISYRDGSKYNFDNIGKITSLADRYANAITFIYTGSDLTGITDSTGRVATIGYDQSTTPHRISTVTDPNSNVYNFSYQGSSLYRVTNPEANYGAGRGYWEYQYYADGLLKTKRDQNGNISQYSYYADKKMQTATDPNGRTRTIVYPTTTDILRTTTFTEKDGGQWLYTFDSSTGVIKQKTDPNGKLTNFYYYANGLVKAKTEPKDGANRLTIFYKHDAYGNLEIETDPVDLSTYSPAIDPDTVTNVADLASKTPPIKAAQHYIYDTNIIANPYRYDRITSVADERGATTLTTSFVYSSDGSGEVVTATSIPGSYVTITKKNTNGSVRESVDANGKTTSFTYYPDDYYNRLDGIVGLLWTITAPNGTSTSYLGYDNNGNLFRAYAYDNTGADHFSIIYQFDNLNRLIQQIKIPNTLPSSSTHYDYDLAGNLKSLIDAEQRETKYEYNYNRQATKIADAKLNDTVFKYSGSEGNGVDKLIGLYDANVAKNTSLDSQPHTAYIYDDLGRLESETDPLGKKIYYTYYDNGQLKEKYDATNSTPGILLVTYTYNNRGQITDKTFTDGTSEHYTYTANGQLQTASNQNISYTYAYYTDGRLQSVTDTTNNRQISYDQYDSIGQRKQVTVLKGAGADQRVITYDYDTANRPWHITSNAGQFTYEYDTSGRRQTVTYPNQLTVNYRYDDLSRLTSLTHKNGATPFASFNYTHDKVGNRLTKTGTVNETYGYDELYRLLSVTATKSETYTYDPAGNRTKGSGAIDTAYQSNAANQMTHGRKLTYGYDNRGNQNKRTVTGVPDTEKGWTLDWDNENRLKSMTKVKKKDGVVLETRAVTYKYDPFGRRIEKKFEQTKGGVTETETTQYVYNNEDIVVEYFTTAGGTEKTFYTHGHGIDEPLAMERNSGGTSSFYYYHQDALGSITNITNASKTVVQSYTYDAYGMATPSDNSFRNSYQHTGREYDWETGTLYMRERPRDLMDGNFLSKDPIGFAGGINLYQYVQGNVTNYTDPIGYGPIASAYGGVVGAVTGLSGSLAQGGDWKEALVSTIAGGAVGALVGAIDPTEVTAILVISGTAGAAGDFAGQVTTNILKGKQGLANISKSSIVGSAIGSASGGWIGSLATKYFLKQGATKAVSYGAASLGMAPAALGGPINKEVCK